MKLRLQNFFNAILILYFYVIAFIITLNEKQ